MKASLGYRRAGIITLAAAAIIGLGFVAAHLSKSPAVCDTLTLTGEITPDTFLAARDCLVNSLAEQKTFVVAASGGGSWEAALALGILIDRHGWNVEVQDICASSCANFIFPAGKTKYLQSDAMLLFHGGPHQHNMLEKMIEAEKAAQNGATTAAKDPGRRRMEGQAIIDDQGRQRVQVLEFLSITNVTGAVDLVTRLRSASDQFYEDLGVNLLLPHYGQIGQYEPIYKSYKYGGFIYRLDSLRKLGISNIEVEGGEWHPERHRDYPDVYEVTYP